MSLPVTTKPSGRAKSAPNSRELARERAIERIFDAAKRVFGEQGFAAASVAAIGREAGVTKGLVHHYFGSKRELWDRLKEHYGSELSAQVAVPAPEESGLERILAWVRGSFGYSRRNPEFLRLIAWAELENEYELPPSLLSASAEIDAMFCDARATGAIRDDIDPLHARAMVHQMMIGWSQTKRFFCPAWGRDPDSEKVDEAYLEDLIALVRAGLAPRANDNRRPT